MVLRLSVCVAALLATGQCLPVVQAQVPFSPCVFHVNARIRLVNEAATASAGVLVERYYDHSDSTWLSRGQAQARVVAILEHGLRVGYYPPGGLGTWVPEHENWYGPHVVMRATIIPEGLGGDPGQCYGQ